MLKTLSLLGQGTSGGNGSSNLTIVDSSTNTVINNVTQITIKGGVKGNSANVVLTSSNVTANPTTFGMVDIPHGFRLTKAGAVIPPGASGWNAGMVESPSISWDPKGGQYRMIYTGYSGTLPTPNNANLGYATSNDLINWTQYASNPFFGGSGGTSAPDNAAVTGGYVWYENNQYYLFYIGMTQATGYEQGTKTMCMATSSDFVTWSRQGAIIAPTANTWRSQSVFHPNIVKRAQTYYLFFNAANATTETIGYATASNIAGPWTVDDVNSPVVTIGTGGSFDNTNVRDPFVMQAGETWYMNYCGNNGSLDQDGMATTSDAEFPFGWLKYANNPILAAGAAGSIDSKTCGKPNLWVTPERLYHFYTADNGSGTIQIALAVDNTLASAAWTKINAATITGSNTNSITFSTIPQYFSNLKLIFNGRQLGTNTNDNLVIQANGDTGANSYTFALIFSNSNQANAVPVAANSSGAFIGGICNAAGFLSLPSTSEVTIPNYAGTGFNKAIMSQAGNPTNASAYQITVAQAFWKSNAAIANVTISVASGANFAANTTAFLYGMA